MTTTNQTITVVAAPNDAATFLHVKRAGYPRPIPFRVTAHTLDPEPLFPDLPNAPSRRDVFDVAKWSDAAGWVTVLRDLDGTLADDIEQAVYVATVVLFGA